MGRSTTERCAGRPGWPGWPPGGSVSSRARRRGGSASVPGIGRPEGSPPRYGTYRPPAPAAVGGAALVAVEAVGVVAAEPVDRVGREGPALREAGERGFEKHEARH